MNIEGMMANQEYIEIKGAKVHNLKNINNNIGLIGVMKDLVADNNSVALVDHDPQILRSANHIIEMGPGAGANGIHDELRKIFARTQDANAEGYKAGDFSYNTGKLRCPVCDGTGTVSLDVQFLPDVDIPCPECHGSRYSKEAWLVHITGERNMRTFRFPN